MRHMILTVAVMTAGVGVLAGCASSGTTASDRIAEILADPRVGEPVDKVCFARSIDGFSENARDSVVLSRGVNSDFLVLMKGCPRLRDAQSIGLTSRGSCLRQSDQLIVSDSAFSLGGQTPSGPDRCWVDALYEWNQDADGKDDTDEGIEGE